MILLGCMIIAAMVDGLWAKPVEHGNSPVQDPVKQIKHSPLFRTKRQSEITLSQLCDCEAIAYPHPNFVGRSLSIRQQNADFRNDLFTNIVDSIKIKGKCRWLFYSSPNFLGETHFLALFNYSSSPSWGGPGDHLSSARVLPPAGTHAIALFDLHYYTGRMLILYQSCNNLEDFSFDNQTSSFIVIGGSWKLYPNKGCVGNYDSKGVSEYPRSYGNHIGDNRMSSVKLG